MSDLHAYLEVKRAALAARSERFAANPPDPTQLRATVTAAGRSGIRHVKIRDFQFITDSPADFAGFDLAPGAPEVLLGILGACVTHSFLIQAAQRDLLIDAIRVEVHGQLDPLAGQAGHEDVPVYPHGIGYAIHLTTNADAAALEEAHAAVRRVCPLLNLVRASQEVPGELVVNASAAGSIASEEVALVAHD